MKNKLSGIAIFLGLTLISRAATVMVESDITLFLSGASGITRDVTFTDGVIGSVTLRFTMTTLSTEGFTSLGSRVGIGPGGSNDDTNHFDQGEDLNFDVKYQSATGAVDTSSIAFRFDQIGFRGGGETNSTVSWAVNGNLVTSFAAGGLVPGGTELYRPLDSVFTTIGFIPGEYSGKISTTRTGVFPFDGTAQFSSEMGGGLQFSVSYVPEPSSAMLVGMGFFFLSRRRR